MAPNEHLMGLDMSHLNMLLKINETSDDIDLTSTRMDTTCQQANSDSEDSENAATLISNLRGNLKSKESCLLRKEAEIARLKMRIDAIQRHISVNDLNAVTVTAENDESTTSDNTSDTLSRTNSV